MAKKLIEGSEIEESAESPATEKAEAAMGDPAGTHTAALKSGRGSSVSKRPMAKPTTGGGSGSPSPAAKAVRSGVGGVTKRRKVKK